MWCVSVCARCVTCVCVCVTECAACVCVSVCVNQFYVPTFLILSFHSLSLDKPVTDQIFL